MLSTLTDQHHLLIIAGRVGQGAHRSNRIAFPAPLSASSENVFAYSGAHLFPLLISIGIAFYLIGSPPLTRVTRFSQMGSLVILSL